MPAISRLAGQSLANPRAHFRHLPTKGARLFAYSTQIPQSFYPGERWRPPDGQPIASVRVCGINGSS